MNTYVGVLSMILTKFGARSVLGIDNNEQAIECAKANVEKEKEKYGNKINFEKGDIFPSNNEKKFDIIICNPPFIPLLSHNTMEDSIFDAQENFLNSFFKNVSSFLTDEGVFIFFYSNFGAKLNLQQFGRIEKLCFEHRFDVLSHHSFPSSLYVPLSADFFAPNLQKKKKHENLSFDLQIFVIKKRN